MGRENGFPLSVTVIILAIFGLFVGYLLGNWVIQILIGGPSEYSPLAENPTDNRIEQEIILEDQETQESYSGQFNFEDELITDSTISDYERDSNNNQIQGEVFAIQVGAFNDYSNAQILKDELAGKGFQAVVTEGIPYKVQLGATPDRSRAEKTLKQLKELGYEAFITH